MNKNSPQVSVITPTYNHEKYIELCIRSILNQTFEDWELLVIDDGSTDSTPEIVKSFQDPRIKLITQNHVGIYGLKKTYNKGLFRAQGKFVAILEGDDLWPADKLEIQLSIMQRDASVVLSWGRRIIIDERGNIMGSYKGLPISIKRPNQNIINNIPTGSILNSLFFYNFIHATTVLIRKDSLIDIGGFQQPHYVPYVDYPTWLHLALIGRFKWINETLGCWRRHEMQYTNTHSAEMIDIAARLSTEFLEYVKINYADSIYQNIRNVSSEQILQDRLNLRLLELGKRHLYINDTDIAKQYFLKALSSRNFYIKVAAMNCYLSSYTTFNLERFKKYIKI